MVCVGVNKIDVWVGTQIKCVSGKSGPLPSSAPPWPKERSARLAEIELFGREARAASVHQRPTAPGLTAGADTPRGGDLGPEQGPRT